MSWEPGVASFSNLLGRLACFNVDFEITSLLKQKFTLSQAG